MCTGLEIAALAATAAGTATDAYAQHVALVNQDKIAAQGIITQGALQKQGEGDVTSLTGQLAKSNATTLAKSAGQLSDYQNALKQSSLITNSADPNVPGADKAYKSEQAKASGGAQDYVNAIAGSAATTQGTDLERVGENEKIGDTAGQLGLLNTQASEQNYLTKLKIQAVQPNPWLEGLGQVLKGAGAVMSFGAAGAAGAAAGAAGAGAGTGIGATALSGSAGLATGATAAGGNIWGQAASTASSEI